jgi:hypothetical protein
MISTVGSSTFAELTTRRITGARGREVSEALHARPIPRDGVAPSTRVLVGGSEPSGTSTSAVGSLGLSYGTPASRRVGCNDCVASDSNTRDGPSIDAARRRDVVRAVQYYQYYRYNRFAPAVTEPAPRFALPTVASRCAPYELDVRGLDAAGRFRYPDP